jgi:transcriptional regulator with XRE-family HTH domain
VTILRFFSLIADVLLRLRHERGESQVSVGLRAGMSDAQISKYERGIVTPDVATLLQLLGAYGQHLVIMPQHISETMPERDAVIAAASKWWAIEAHPDPDPATRDLLESVARLVAAELRQRPGRAPFNGEAKAADR